MCKEWIESVAYEPIWVFHGLGKDVQRLAELVGRKIAIGAPGSGVQYAARKLLEPSKSFPPKKLSSLSNVLSPSDTSKRVAPFCSITFHSGWPIWRNG
jgi:hypothetical protein